MIPVLRYRVSPFGYPRIYACLQLPVAFRRWPRPSSPSGAKASTIRPFYLDLCERTFFRLSEFFISLNVRFEALAFSLFPFRIISHSLPSNEIVLLFFSCAVFKELSRAFRELLILNF